MLSRSLSALAAAALIAGIVVVSAPEAAAQRGVSKPRIRQIKPLRGDTVRVGDTVMIEWEFYDGDGIILSDDQLRWCEQEIFLSLDGGRTIERRITIRLDPADRTQEWVVPNTVTDTAVLDNIATGITERLACELAYPKGESSDPTKLVVRYTPSGKASSNLTQVTDVSKCSQVQDGWYYDDAKAPSRIILGPSTCTTANGATDGKLEALVGCAAPAPR